MNADQSAGDSGRYRTLGEIVAGRVNYFRRSALSATECDLSGTALIEVFDRNTSE